MILYMKVTDDEYELPVAVADSGRELSLMLGLKKTTVAEWMCKCRRKGKKCCYVKVEVEDEDI